MGSKNESVEKIVVRLDDLLKAETRTVLTFKEFLEKVRSDPPRLLRNIFQLLSDFIKDTVGEGEEDYPEDTESIGFVGYDLSHLLVEGMDHPFFADRLFANRFVRIVEQVRTGMAQQNKIFVFEGPPGCGKSTFLNNLLIRFCEFTDRPEGERFEVVWKLDPKMFEGDLSVCSMGDDQKIIEFSCPSHDHPFLVLPKKNRMWLIEQLLLDSQISEDKKKEILTGKEYEWLFKRSCCPVCKAMFYELLDKIGSVEKVLRVVFARSYKFDRTLGEGVSVFSPGDVPSKQTVLCDKDLQDRLNAFFGSNRVPFIYSRYAKTNDGVYALMDIKGENKRRFRELHGIVSEGYHKIDECVEEPVSSLFFAVANPGDIVVNKEPEKTDDTEKEKEQAGLNIDSAFADRIDRILVPYVTEVGTEVNIYKSIFGDEIEKVFLPGVLENFARLIISSRLAVDSPALKEWLGDKFAKQYEKYCDSNGLLLKMEIYGGKKPSWLSSEHVAAFTKEIRKKLILKEGMEEGKQGISERDALNFFRDFYSSLAKNDKLITMANVSRFFRNLFKIRVELKSLIPRNFIDSLVNWYNYTVVQQIKESMYDYNEERIYKDVIHYIFAVNQDIGRRVVCPYTKEVLEITEDFLKTVEDHFLTDNDTTDEDRKYFREDIMESHTRLIAQEGINLKIQETELFEGIYNTYVSQLKEKVMEPFLKNKSFREAVKVFGEKEFETFDTRIRENVSLMISKLCRLFGYTKQGAKEVCIYALDAGIIEKFAK